jgi:hypothetical protein
MDVKVKIFVCTHKPFEPPKDSIYVPLHVGKKGKESLGYLGDDTGDEISEKNCYYSELTGLYWAAHNCPDADIKGSCHYRRYLINEQGKAYTAAEIEEILAEYDMMTTKTLSLRSTYFDGYRENHNIDDLILLEKVLQKDYPAYYPVFEQLVHQNKTYFGNMIICKRELFDAYVNWLFEIFFKMEPQMDFSGYDDYHKRVFGFLSEFLLKVYVIVNDLKVHESVVGMVGEKKETIEVKNRLAELIMEKKLAEAKEYFLGFLKKRPDILMEASDVNGELKLAMQIITSCEHEYETYGKSVLDEKTDYGELMRYFNQVNRIVSARKLGLATKEEIRWLEDNQVSEMVLRIADMIGAENG